ncbi:MAG: YdeI/OmpD-associated family protein [Acidobacteriia bacterium]|nr:YdeI/OmpD-associated family protein [Terriglobia bacterium]
MTKPKAKSFRATLERAASRLNWVLIHIPLDVAKLWGKRGQLRVRGEINGFAFRSSLFPTRKGGHIMIVNKRMQAGGKVAPGSTAQFLLEPDTEVRIVTMPDELKRALAEDRSLRRWFDRLNHSTRNEISKWVSDVKSAEARTRRAEQIAERLLATMEAERELPPILQVAFAQDPRARQGWALMSPSRRRGHLLGIFYYRDPESRARRVEKAVRDAAELAEKRLKS